MNVNHGSLPCETVCESVESVESYVKVVQKV